jgi:hypothetical protein
MTTRRAWPNTMVYDCSCHFKEETILNSQPSHRNLRKSWNDRFSPGTRQG